MAHEKTSSQKREVRLHSEKQEALRQGPKRQVQCSQLKGYRESKALGVGKNEVVLERGIFRKKILSQPPAEKDHHPQSCTAPVLLSPSALPVHV